MTKDEHLNKLNLDNFQSLGSNCEVGFVLTAAGLKENTLFKWASTPLSSLLKLFKNDFQDIFQIDNLMPQADKFVIDTANGIGFHTSHRAHQIDGKYKFTNETVEMFERIYRRENFFIQNLVSHFKESFQNRNVYVRTLKNEDDLNTILNEKAVILQKIHADSTLLLIRSESHRDLDNDIIKLFENNIKVEYIKNFANDLASDQFNESEWTNILIKYR